ncbi:hypothetical protein M0R45_026880 [Rubus argutus]|uniref:Uncharacterized protein n=1 Tax=Rubus argutus TaxID=59490 RepID=A0AAW1WYQ0_RUBAR
MLLHEPVLEPPPLSDCSRLPLSPTPSLLTSHDTQHGTLALRLQPSLSPPSQEFYYHRPITIKIVESLRENIVAGKLKSGSEIKALKKNVLDLSTVKGKTEFQLGYKKPTVVMSRDI